MSDDFPAFALSEEHQALREAVRALADVIHPYPAFNRILGAVLGELAAKLD